MTTSVLITNERPDFLIPVSITKDTVIQKAPQILFYFRGGANILAMTIKGHGGINVYIPPFSRIQAAGVFGIIDNLSDTILELAKKDKIGVNQWFLFDTIAKIILTQDSFMDWFPYYSLRTTLFITADPKALQYNIYYPQDTSDYGALQFLTTLVAREDVMRPSTGIWSTIGKKLLSFLASNRYSTPVSFEWETGAWDQLSLDNFGDTDNPSIIETLGLDTSRAQDLAKDDAIILQNNKREISEIEVLAPDPFKDKGGISLLDVLTVGVDSFFHGVYRGTIDVNIDTMPDIFRSIKIDTGPNICTVVLQPKADITDWEVEEELQSQNLQIVRYLG